MKTAFEIYIRAVGIYALLTIPALILPIMYVISLGYVLTFGWFAWFLFTAIYLITGNFRMRYRNRFAILFIGVIVSVAFAYNMIGVFDSYEDMWDTGFLFFPLAAVIAGWISLHISRRKVMQQPVLDSAETTADYILADDLNEKIPE
jgi:hypothetical protein